MQPQRLSELTKTIKASQPNRPGEFIDRAIQVAIAAALDPLQRGVAANAAERYPNDRITPALVTKGAVVPASTTAQEWAGLTSIAAVGDFVLSLAEMSAFANVLNAAPRVPLAGVSSVQFPARSGTPATGNTAWIGEGQPFPVKKNPVVIAATLGPPQKLGSIQTCTRELATAAPMVLPNMIREDFAFGLDSLALSDAAATDVAPAGILYGVSPVSAKTGGNQEAMLGDLEQLSFEIAPVTSNLVYIAHTAQANAIKLRMGSIFARDIPIWGTTGVAPGVVIALDPQALVSGFGPAPEITVSTQAVLHMEDSSPSAIADSSPPSHAAPVRSLFQTNTVAIRAVLRCAWCWRTPGAVAWLTGATWGGASPS
jgi:hypothetical protein